LFAGVSTGLASAWIAHCSRYCNAARRAGAQHSRMEWSFGRRPPAEQQRHLRKDLPRHVREGAYEFREVLALGQVRFVEIKAPIHLQLQRLHAARRVAVVFGDEAASIGSVDLDVVAGALQHVAHEAGELGVAGGAEAVAEHEMWPTAG